MTYRTSETNELEIKELELVWGGMKTDPNYTNKEVIDARGGQMDAMWWTLTFDVNGKVSSVTPK